MKVFAINLKKRNDRKAHITTQFLGIPEFDLKIVNAVEHKNGAFGLWQTIVKIISLAKQNNAEYAIICEDDHQFSKEFNTEKLLELISESSKRNADILLGGISWCDSAIQISEELFLVNQFTGLQFTIVFDQLFDKILNTSFKLGDAADFKFSQLSENILVVFPFISTQVEFGYSDVTNKNNVSGYVSDIFQKSSDVLENLSSVKKYYNEHSYNQSISWQDFYNDITFPSYVLLSVSDDKAKSVVAKEFTNKPEFNTKYLFISKSNHADADLWEVICEIIRQAICNEEEFLILVKEHHEFSEFYKKEFLIRNIVQSHLAGVDLLYGGTDGFGQAVPITTDRFWINPVYSSQFIVIYAKIYSAILNYEFRDADSVDLVLSELTSHKMLVNPVISLTKDHTRHYLHINQLSEKLETKDRLVFLNQLQKSHENQH